MKIDITTVVTIIKCAIGAGSFTLPKAFQIGGLWISFFLTLLLGYLCSYTLQLLVICERTIYLKIHNDNNNDNDKKHKHSLNQYIVVNENEDCDNNTTTNTTNNDNNNNDNKTNEYKQLTYSEIGSYIYPGLYHQ